MYPLKNMIFKFVNTRNFPTLVNYVVYDIFISNFPWNLAIFSE